MGSLVPGWDNPKHEPDFRELSKPQEPEVPEWLQRVRSTDSEHDVKLHRAMNAANNSLGRSSFTRTSPVSSPLGSPSHLSYLSDGSGRFSSQLKRTSLAKEAQHDEERKPQAEEQISWWRRLESSYANAKPDAEKPENYRGGNYVPQHAVAKHHLKNDH